MIAVRYASFALTIAWFDISRSAIPARTHQARLTLEFVFGNAVKPRYAGREWRVLAAYARLLLEYALHPLASEGGSKAQHPRSWWLVDEVVEVDAGLSKDEFHGWTELLNDLCSSIGSARTRFALDSGEEFETFGHAFGCASFDLFAMLSAV